MKTLFTAVERQMLCEAASQLKHDLDALPVGTVLAVNHGGFGGASFFLRTSKGWDQVTYTTRRQKVYLGTRHANKSPLDVSQNQADMGVVVEGMRGKKVTQPIHLDALPEGARVEHSAYSATWTKRGDKWQDSRNQKWVESVHFESMVDIPPGLKVTKGKA